MLSVEEITKFEKVAIVIRRNVMDVVVQK